MAISVSKENIVEAALQRSARVALVLAISAVGLAAVYYAVLYLVAQ